MAINSINYWRKQDVDPACLKSLVDVFSLKREDFKVVSRLNRNVPISEIIDTSVKEWDIAYREYSNVLRQYVKTGSRKGYEKTELWKREKSYATGDQNKAITERFNNLFNLYDSIKTRGFKWMTPNFVKLMDMSELKPIKKPWGTRISEKYYRITGMRRVIICKFLGIKEIKCRVLIIKLRS